MNKCKCENSGGTRSESHEKKKCTGLPCIFFAPDSDCAHEPTIELTGKHIQTSGQVDSTSVSTIKCH